MRAANIFDNMFLMMCIWLFTILFFNNKKYERQSCEKVQCSAQQSLQLVTYNKTLTMFSTTVIAIGDIQ